jgi:hydroxyacylglutathione hydrolase
MADMEIHKIVVGQLGVNCFIVGDGKSPEVLVIDPGDEPDRIADFLDSKALKPKVLLVTHAHFDHICAVGDLKRKYGSDFIMHEDERETYGVSRKLCISWGYETEDFPPPDRTVREGDVITVGSLAFSVIHTPGHSPGGICLRCGTHVFTGDTLFNGSIGRTDLPGGDMDTLLGSLRKLTALPGETSVHCGHSEDTTIAEEMRINPFLTNRFEL